MADRRRAGGSGVRLEVVLFAAFDFAEGAAVGQFFDVFGHRFSLPDQELIDGAAQAVMGDVVRL